MGFFSGKQKVNITELAASLVNYFICGNIEMDLGEIEKLGINNIEKEQWEKENIYLKMFLVDMASFKIFGETEMKNILLDNVMMNSIKIRQDENTFNDNYNQRAINYTKVLGGKNEPMDFPMKRVSEEFTLNLMKENNVIISMFALPFCVNYLVATIKFLKEMQDKYVFGK